MIERICQKSIMNRFPNGNRLMILRKQGNQLLIYPLPTLVHYIYIYIYIYIYTQILRSYLPIVLIKDGNLAQDSALIITLE